MQITKFLDFEPAFRNNIQIEDKTFNITIEKAEVEIICSWDYGYGGSGTECFRIPLSELKELIEEIERS